MFAFYHEWRKHIRCIITVPYGGTLRVFKTKWIAQGKDTFDLKIGKDGFTYNIVSDKAIMSSKNNPILYYIKDKTDPISINREIKEGKSSKYYHVALKTKVVKDALEEGRERTMLVLIGVFIIIIVGISLFSLNLLSQQNDKIMELSKKLASILANQTKGIIIR